MTLFHKMSRRKWTPAEDEILFNVCLNNPKMKWKEIAKRVPNRNPKQCRDRWDQYLRPDIIHEPWSEEEDKILLQKVEEMQHQWELISKLIKGRTGVQCKNRYNLLKRKIDRELEIQDLIEEIFPIENEMEF